MPKHWLLGGWYPRRLIVLVKITSKQDLTTKIPIVQYPFHLRYSLCKLSFKQSFNNKPDNCYVPLMNSNLILLIITAERHQRMINICKLNVGRVRTWSSFRLNIKCPFEMMKGFQIQKIIRSRKPTLRWSNEKKDKTTNNSPQNTTQKTKDWATRTSL